MGLFITKKGDQEDLDERTVNPFAELMTKGDRNVPRRRRLKVALFDLDGTLFDTEEQYTVFWGEVGRRYGLGDDFAYRIKGSTLTSILRNFATEDDRQAVTAGIDAYEERMEYRFFPGALEFVRNLKANGVLCAIVTSSNKQKMASVARQMPEFESLFDRVFTAEDFKASKPAPDCYLHGAEVFGAGIDECVVFEDAFNGLESGMASGIFTIGIASYNPVEAIRDKCNYVLENFVDFDYEKLMAVLNV